MRVQKQGTGRDLLTLVAQSLDIYEMDFFGLVFYDTKDIWACALHFSLFTPIYFTSKNIFIQYSYMYSVHYARLHYYMLLCEYSSRLSLSLSLSLSFYSLFSPLP